jgi:16S rRNA C1402 (ribose-2'-O) methylase RsmI
MMLYVLICLCLSLAGVAGLQFFYMVYLERIDRERKKRINELERHAKYLAHRLEDAEVQLSEQNKLLEAVYDEFEDENGEEEVWADVIEER